MGEKVDQIIKDIKSLKIQGARNVAREAIRALSISAQKTKAKDVEKAYKELLNVAQKLTNSRPTEPMMRNMIEDSCRFALMRIREQKIESIEEFKNSIAEKEEKLANEMEIGAKKLSQNGAKLIPDDSTVLTHCHSSTSTKVLMEAKKMGKKFKVICFETRPRYQGRETAKELLDAKIDTTLTVDGAMALMMKKADMVIVGADSITSRGDLINKIGTSTLAHMAHMNDVSFYCAAELFKYNPLTLMGEREKIEERDPKEVWEEAPKKLKIKNPAFEATSSKYINGFITEAGVIPPQAVFSIASEKLGKKIEFGEY